MTVTDNEQPSNLSANPSWSRLVHEFESLKCDGAIYRNTIIDHCIEIMKATISEGDMGCKSPHIGMDKGSTPGEQPSPTPATDMSGAIKQAIADKRLSNRVQSNGTAWVALDELLAIVKATMGDGDTRKSRGGDTGSTIADPSYTTSPTTAGVIEQLEAAKFCNPEVSVGNAMHNFALDKAIAIVQQAQLASRDGGGE